jgi:hypothetical protein
MRVKAGRKYTRHHKSKKRTSMRIGKDLIVPVRARVVAAIASKVIGL